MDTPIRKKTPLELAAEKRREQTVDSEQAFIQAMATALRDADYTCDTDADDVEPADERYAVGAGLKALVSINDWSFLTEFITESGGPKNDRAMFDALADFMLRPSDESAWRFVGAASTRARWYGESFLQEALDMLDSASEIERDRQVDMAIDERKSA